MQTFFKTKRAWMLALPLIIAACVCSTSTLPAGTGGSGGPAPSLGQYGIDRDNALVLLASEPDGLDPATWLFGADGAIADLFSGLVRLGGDMHPVPDLAEGWDVSPDGTVYTFHLRENAVFHNGKPVTADDVKFSWERAISPELASLTAMTYLNDIVGAQAVADGDEEEISGLRIIDDHTLEVTIDGAKPYFIYKLTYPTAWIVDRETVDEIDTNPNGTGPFKLFRHDENEVMIVERNPDYHLGAPELQYVVYLLDAGYSVRLYETGDIDMVAVPEELVERALSASDPLYGNVQENSSLCTDFMSIDVSQPPFEDPLVRKAFALAIDKDRYNEVIFSNKGIMGGGLFPPGIPGYTPDVAPIPYDPEAALQALSQSTYGSADALPPIIFTTIGSAGDIGASEGLLLQMWQQALGVTVNVEGLDFESYYDEVYGGNHGQIISSGWCADYPDPENFAMLFYTGTPQNHGKYSNPAYDALIDEANVEHDVERRLRLYQEAQQLLIDDAAALFISHSQAYYIVTKPYVRGFLATPIGIPQHLHVTISVSE